MAGTIELSAIEVRARKPDDKFFILGSDGQLKLTLISGMISGNNPPVIYDQNLTVSAGSDLTITLGQSVDVDGDTVSYTLAGAGSSHYTTSTSNTGVFNVNTEGTYVIDVSASDGNGGTASSTITITVTANVTASISITAPTTGTSHDEGTSITFTGTGSDSSTGDISSSIIWTDKDGVTLHTGNTFNTAALEPGMQDVTAKVTGSDTNIVSDSVTLNIRAVAKQGDLLINNIEVV